MQPQPLPPPLQVHPRPPPAERSASHVRFHIGDDEIEMTNSDEKAGRQEDAAAAATVPVPSAVLPSSPQSASRLSRVDPVDLRRALDPFDRSISRAVLESWDEAKLAELALLLTPAGVTPLINKLAGGAHNNTLRFTDVAYRCTHSDHGLTQHTEVLQPMSGFVRSGELVGVLGAADSGVTPLLRILAGRVELQQSSSRPVDRSPVTRLLQRPSWHASGDLSFNGRPLQSSYRQDVGYVSKDDSHLPLLTVRETLMFSAELRQAPIFSPKLRRFLVSLAMQLLGLTHIQDARVGDATVRGCSGGERRRLSVGCELVAGHHLIIADQPTSGLDSHSATHLFQTAKFASLTGRAMMASIVQPTQQIIDMCDRIMVLCKGSMIFQGKPADAEAHFNRAGFVRPQGKSVAAWIEELSAAPEKFCQPADHGPAAGSASSAEDALAVAVDARQVAWKRLDLAYRKSTFHQRVMECIATTGDRKESERIQEGAMSSSVVANGSTLDVAPAGPSSSSSSVAPAALFDFPHGTGRYRLSFPQQLRLLLHRQSVLMQRDRGLWMIFWVQSVILGLLLGSLYWNLGTAQSDVRIRFGLFWFVMMTQSLGVAQMLPTLCAQRVSFYKQVHNRYFHPAAYYVATVLPQLPVGAIQVMLLVTILYPMCGLINGIGSGEYWFMCLLLILVNWTARSFVMLICSVSPSELIAQMLIPICTLLFSALSGFMNPADEIPTGWRWLHTASYFTYTLRGLSINENKHLDWSCAAGTPCPYPTGDSVLNLYSMGGDFSQRWTDLQSIVWFLLAFHCGAIAGYCLVDWSAEEPAEWPEWVTDEEADDTPTQANGTQHAQQDKPRDIESGQALARRDRVSTPAPADASSTPALPALSSVSPAPVPATPTARAAPPVVLTWTSLLYSVPVAPPKGVSRDAAPSTRTLLHEVSGFARPGMMIALMGASGAGKTTLLDVLAGKKSGGIQHGEVRVNGSPVDRARFSRLSGYVEQQDSHDDQATVREAIEFSARLRLPVGTSDQEIHRAVRHVMHVLNLTHLQNERIGDDEGGGVTPAIRKKVTIAVELVAMPSVLFLDEPTTGLDSSGALSVLSVVRDLSRVMSVVCTIHQPSQEILNHFDALYLLEAGQLVFFGPIAEVAPYMEKQGWATWTPEQNTAEFAIAAIKKGQTITDHSTGSKCDIARVFQQSSQYAWMQQHIDDSNHERSDALTRASSVPSAPLASSAVSPSVDASYPGFGRQFLVLLVRFLRHTSRDRLSWLSRVCMALFFSFVVATLFADLSLGQQAGANRIALLFMTVMFPSITAVLKLPQLIQTRPLYFRETGSHTYSALAYSLSRWVAEFPLILVELSLLSVIVYFSTGLTLSPDGVPFAVFLVTLIAVRVMTFSYVDLMAGIVANPATATATATLPVIIGMLFAGFLIPHNKIATGWLWLHYLSMIRYPLELLAVNELRSLELTCAASSMLRAPSSYTTCPLPPSGLKCPLQCGADLLSQFGMDDSVRWMWLNFLIIVVFMSAFRVMAYLALRFVNHVKR